MNNLNVERVCRSCLRENVNMKSLLDGSNTENNLAEMFVAVTSIEVKSEENVTVQICDECEERLATSYSFRQQCRTSHQVLQSYSVKVERSDKLKNDASDAKGDFDGDRSGSGSESDRSARKKRKQTLRLSQFSYEDVAQAIEQSRRKFLENKRCIRCGFVGSNARALLLHVSYLHKELKERWCAHCNAESDDIQAHMRQHADNDFKCRFCEKNFQGSGHLTEHLRSHSGLRPYKCDACEKSFISQRHLKVHFRIHSNERPYKCDVCAKAFVQLSSLKNHLKQHDRKECERPQTNSVKEEAPLEDTIKNKLCTDCGKQFKTTTKLRVHMRVHTGEAPYKCSYCSKKVSTRNQLVVHERTHTGEKPHVCHVCGRGFAQSSVLNTHMRLHTGRPEVCKICDQRFCRPAELRLHMRKHTGEKPYLCNECGQAFVQRSHLVEHHKTHSDARPYQCSFCEKAFKQSSSLKSHVQIHLGYKPYKCSQCPYACRQSYSLTQHMKQHAADRPRPDRPHVCHVCAKAFTTAAMLNSHFCSVHQVNADLF